MGKAAPNQSAALWRYSPELGRDGDFQAGKVYAAGQAVVKDCGAVAARDLEAAILEARAAMVAGAAGALMEARSLDIKVGAVGGLPGGVVMGSCAHDGERAYLIFADTRRGAAAEVNAQHGLRCGDISVLVAVHEAAHAFAPRWERHGRLFARLFLDGLTGLNREAGALLRCAYRVHGVEHDARRSAGAGWFGKE